MLKKNLTKKDIIKKIHKEIGFSKNFSSKIVDSFFNNLINELSSSKNIKISSFGTFKILNKGERVGRNPKTKEEFKIKPRKVAVFRPAKQFKFKINSR